MTSKKYTFDSKLIYNHIQITSKQYVSKVKRYVLDTHVIEMTKEEILLAIAKGEIAVEIKKKVNKKKSSTDTFSGGVKKIKPQKEFVDNLQFILHQMRKSCYNYDTR